MVVTLEGSSVLSYKNEHLIQQSPREGENLGPHKTLHTDIYSSFIPKCQNLEATNMSFHKLWCIQTMNYYQPKKETSSQAKKKMLRN